MSQQKINFIHNLFKEYTGSLLVAGYVANKQRFPKELIVNNNVEINGTYVDDQTVISYFKDEVKATDEMLEDFKSRKQLTTEQQQLVDNLDNVFAKAAYQLTNVQPPVPFVTNQEPSTKLYEYDFSKDSNDWEFNEDNLYTSKGLPRYYKEGFSVPKTAIKEYIVLSKVLIPPTWTSSMFMEVIYDKWAGHITNNIDVFKMLAHITLPYGKPINAKDLEFVKNVNITDLGHHMSLIVRLIKRIQQGYLLKGMRFARNQMTKDANLDMKFKRTRIGSKKDLPMMIFPSVEAKLEYVKSKYGNVKPKLDMQNYKWTEDLKILKVEKEDFDAQPEQVRKQFLHKINNNEFFDVWRMAHHKEWMDEAKEALTTVSPKKQFVEHENQLNHQAAENRRQEINQKIAERKRKQSQQTKEERDYSKQQKKILRKERREEIKKEISDNIAKGNVTDGIRSVAIANQNAIRSSQPNKRIQLVLQKIPHNQVQENAIKNGKPMGKKDRKVVNKGKVTIQKTQTIHDSDKMEALKQLINGNTTGHAATFGADSDAEFPTIVTDYPDTASCSTFIDDKGYDPNKVIEVIQQTDHLDGLMLTPEQIKQQRIDKKLQKQQRKKIQNEAAKVDSKVDNNMADQSTFLIEEHELEEHNQTHKEKETKEINDSSQAQQEKINSDQKGSKDKEFTDMKDFVLSLQLQAEKQAKKNEDPVKNTPQTSGGSKKNKKKQKKVKSITAENDQISNKGRSQRIILDFGSQENTIRDAKQLLEDPIDNTLNDANYATLDSVEFKKWLNVQLSKDEDFKRNYELYKDTPAFKAFMLNDFEYANYIKTTGESKDLHAQMEFSNQKNILNDLVRYQNMWNSTKQNAELPTAIRKSKKKRDKRKKSKQTKEEKEVEVKYPHSDYNNKLKSDLNKEHVVVDPDSIKRENETIFTGVLRDVDNDQEIPFVYDIMDEVPVVDQAIVEAAKTHKELYLLNKKKKMSRRQARKKIQTAEYFDDSERNFKTNHKRKEMQRMKDQDFKVDGNKKRKTNKWFNRNNKGVSQQIKPGTKALVAHNKAKLSFYAGHGNQTLSDFDTNTALRKVQLKPKFWENRYNTIWNTSQGITEKASMMLSKQIITLTTGKNMPLVPTTAPSKVRYTVTGEDGTIDWTTMRLLLTKLIDDYSHEKRFKATQYVKRTLVFRSFFSSNLFNYLSVITEGSEVSIENVNIEQINEDSGLNLVTLDIVYPDVLNEEEVEQSDLAYVPSYINSGFQYVGYAVIQFLDRASDESNPLHLSDNYLDKEFATLVNYLNNYKIYTGTMIGQLARYFKCYQLKSSTLCCEEDVIKLVYSNRFSLPLINLKVLDSFEGIVQSLMEPGIMELQMKSSSGLDYGNQKKSIVTALADAIVTTEVLDTRKAPNSWWMVEFKPKQELKSIYNMYSNIRTIFVPQSASQLLSALIFAGTYDIFHPDEIILDTPEKVQEFVEPNLLGITQQKFLKQLILNQNTLKDYKILWSFSDNLYTLVNGKFTSYDGKKMESQIKPQYVKWIGEQIIEDYEESLQTKPLVIFKPVEEIQERDGKHVVLKQLVTSLQPNVFNWFRDEYWDTDQFLGLLSAYLPYCDDPEYIVIEDFFEVNEDADSYTMFALDKKVPDGVKWYLTELLPDLFENTKALINTTVLPLGFLPSGWRATSLLNSVLSLTVYNDFYELIDDPMFTAENDLFEQRLLNGYYKQIDFTKEAVIENIWNLKPGFNNFDFLGFGIVVEDQWTYVCLRLESLYAGTYWFDPANYNKNALINWSLALSKFVSCLFNGGVMIPCMVNSFISLIKQIAAREKDHLVKLYLNYLESETRDIISSSISTPNHAAAIIQKAYEFVIIAREIPPMPPHLTQAIDLLKDVNLVFVKNLAEITKVQSSIVVIEAQFPNVEDRAHRIANSLMDARDPVYGKRLNDNQMLQWVGYLYDLGYFKYIDEWQDEAYEPEAIQMVKDSLHGFLDTYLAEKVEGQD